MRKVTLGYYRTGNNNDITTSIQSITASECTQEVTGNRYVINAVDKDGNIIKALKSAYAANGDAVSISSLNLVIENNGTYYELDDANVSSYSKSFTMGNEETTFSVTYKASSDIVYFREGESFSNGGTTSNSGASGGAYTSYFPSNKTDGVTTLNKGLYRVETYIWNRTGFHINLYNTSKDDANILAQLTGSEAQSKMFVIADDNTATVLGCTSNSCCFDYILIRKINSMSIVGEFQGAWDTTQGIAMTQSTEDPAIWSAVVEDFTVSSEKLTYSYKAIANEMWGIYELPGSGNASVTFYSAGTYKLTFTVNATTHTLNLVQEKDADYTLVGCFNNDETASFFGTTWDVNSTANVLTSNGDGTYSKTYYNVALEAGTIFYKVVEGHSWGTEWGFDNNNADYDVTNAGTYDITFTFNPSATLSNGFNLTCELTTAPTTVAATLGTNGYATFASPYALDLANLPEGLKAYKAAVNGTTVNFTKVTEAVEANTGLLLGGTASETYSIPVASAGNDISSTNAFLVNEGGSTFDAVSGYTYYGLLKNTLTFATFDPTSVAIPASKAYLKVANTTSGARLSVSFDDDNTTTGINNANVNVGDNKVYNLQGQRVDNPKKGLYIVNGKKFINK